MKDEYVWRSMLTPEMVKHLDPDELERLLEELSDAVSATCQDYGVWA